MNSFLSWVGGKKALREQIVSMFPIYYERYITHHLELFKKSTNACDRLQERGNLLPFLASRRLPLLAIQ